MASNTSRNADSTIQIVIHRSPENIPVPFELRGVIAPEKWDFRIMQINTLCAQYAKPLFERIWFIFATLACIIVPAALNRVIFDAITPKALRDAFDRDHGNSDEFRSNRFDGNSDDAIFKYVMRTRLITTAIFIGLVLVLWTPFAIWKRIGYMRARAMTTRWAVEDGTTGASFIPKWTIKTPGVFNINGTVTVGTPPNVPPTLFNPQAYLPPYILAPGQQQPFPAGWSEAQPQAQIPYNPAFPGGGPMTGVPPMHAYGKEGENPFDSSDEKRRQEYEEVKV